MAEPIGKPSQLSLGELSLAQLGQGKTFDNVQHLDKYKNKLILKPSQLSKEELSLARLGHGETCES